jgi:3-methyladenine DNA glycosylase AlkD
MLRGMLPGYAPCASIAERLAAIADFVPAIRNWSICDSCCATYKFAREHRSEVLTFLHPYLLSTAEYQARFGVVMLLQHYLPAPEWVPAVAEWLPQVTCNSHYAQMAVAWCACELNLLHPQTAKTMFPRLSPAVQQLTCRKIRESRRK